MLHTKIHFSLLATIALLIFHRFLAEEIALLSDKEDANLNENPAVVNVTPSYLKNCFYVKAELCQNNFLSEVLSSSANTLNNTTFENVRDTNACQCYQYPALLNSWYCCNITHMSMVSSCHNISSWINLHIINLTIPELDLSTSFYQTLHSLAITDGNIERVNKSFSRVSSIKCLNISHNNISEISQRSLGNVANLKYLDISNNNLTRIPKWNQNQNITVNVKDNKRMICDSLVEAIYRDTLTFVDPNTSFCLANSSFRWFNSTAYVSIKQLDRTRRCLTECPVILGYGNCSCIREEILIMGDVVCRVDCSNLGLTELPLSLPENTFTLNVSHNKIKNFGHYFHTNPTYYTIRVLDADHNQISSISELEGTKFMEQFLRFFLRNNTLTMIPEYLLSNVLRDGSSRLYFADNKLICDCNTARGLKVWLLERSNDIPDINSIMCRDLPYRVTELQEKKMCQSPHDWTDYLYFLILMEILLLIALITKVSYDYWVFKTAGYLPWPASKMPKLPCDWLCES